MYSNRDLRKLLLPLIAEQMLTACMGIADTLMVSNVGAEALSGVSLVDTVNNLIILVFAAMAAGGTIVCAQYLGRGDRPEAREAAGQVILSCTVLSVLPSVLCALFGRPLLGLIYHSVDAGVMEAGVTYFFISALSYPFLGMQQAAASLFRAEGESKIPMIVSAIANAINVAGNALLIFGLNMGVAGAAIATLISRAVSAVVLLVMLRSEKRQLQISQMEQLKPRWRMIRMILRIGIPTGLENGLFQFGKLIVTSTVATLGTAAISAHAMIQMCEGIHGYPSMAIGIGLTTVAGTCMGAGRVDEAKKYTLKLCGLAELAMGIMGIAFAVLLNPIADIAALTPESRELFINIMIIALVCKMLLWVPSFTLPNAMRAAGDVTFCAAVSAASMWAFRVGLTFILCRYLSFGLYGVWLGWFVDWVVRDIFYIWRYLSGRWTQKRVLDPAA